MNPARAAEPSSSPLVLVVGAGGLIGSAVVRELGGSAFQPPRAHVWSEPDALREGFRASLSEFADRVLAEPGRSWGVAWCAGLGVIGSEESQLTRDVAALASFLELLAAERRLLGVPGCVLLCSSAGGAYAGSSACPITESTPVAPSSAYGRAKLAQEQLLASFAAASTAPISTLIARISNVYGPGQRLEKQQGLISHLARCSIYDVPVHVYVSLDTVRDYLFADDAARRVCAGMRRALSQRQHVTKIYASESEISIAGLLGIFRQVAERPLQVVFGRQPVTDMQATRLQLRSEVWPDDPVGVPLLEGIRRVYADQLERFARGLLPAPPAYRRD